MTNVEAQFQLQVEGLWHRITLYDAKLTRGEHLSAFLDEVLSVQEIAAAVIVAGVEGGGDPVLGITRLGCALMTTQEMKERLGATSQIDWANFYFISDMDRVLTRRVCEEWTIIEAISHSIFSIRVIDDSALDIFAPDFTLIKRVQECYPTAQVQSSLLAEMDFPQ